MVGPLDGKGSPTAAAAVVSLLRAAGSDSGSALVAALDPSWRRSDIADIAARIGAVAADTNLAAGLDAPTCAQNAGRDLATCRLDAGWELPAAIEVRRRRDGWRVVGWADRGPDPAGTSSARDPGQGVGTGLTEGSGESRPL